MFLELKCWVPNYNLVLGMAVHTSPISSLGHSQHQCNDPD